jgi:hypothetical protein
MLDLSKPMQTRHGYPTRLIFDQHKHEYGPLVFAILHPEGVECPSSNGLGQSEQC